MSSAAPRDERAGGTTARSRVGARWRRARPAVVLLSLLVLVPLAGVLLTPPTSGGALDPRSADPTGSRAVAQVLLRQGVEVVPVETVDAAVDAAGPGATLVVVDSEVLAPDRLTALAATPADLVLVEPDGPVLAELAPSLAPAGVADPAVRAAACPDPDARAAASALAGGFLVRASGDATVCFPDPDDPGTGSYAVTTADNRTVRVLGQGDVLTNEHLDEEGNAALALRTLGAQPRLVWLMAHPLDTSADQDVSTSDLLPSWVPWAGLWLAVVGALAVLWRGRRLGPLVEEPLPVVVRSAETAEGRAALYRAAAARDRAAAVLRAACLRRVAPALGLPPSARPQEVVAAAARATGRRPDAVAALLLGPAPVDGAALTALADDLDALAQQVLSPTASAGARGGSPAPGREL